MTDMSRRAAVGGLAASGALLAAPALAQSVTRVTLGYTAVSDFLGAFCAQEEGFFRARGLEVNFQLIALNSNIPAAMQADSIQIGGPTPSVMLQAVDGGLDLVAIAGGSVTNHAVQGAAFVAREGAGITDAKSAEGKRVGVPGLGAFLHVLFREWMRAKGADWRRVTFVETPFPQQPDILRGGSVDAVVTGSPILERITGANIGRVAAFFFRELPEGLPAILYSTTRPWAQRNPQLVAAFRAGLAEGVAFIGRDEAKAREHMGKYIRLPPEVIRTAVISFQKPTITTPEIESWLGIMRGQEMLRTNLTAANIVIP